MWSAPVTTAPATGEPVDREEVKTYLRVDGTSMDDQIDRFLSAARVQVEKTTSTKLLEQTVRARADSFADLEQLPIGPVSAVTEIKYLDTAGAEQILDSGSYELFGDHLEVGLRPAIGMTWPQIRPVRAAIAVTMTVGYGDAAALPEDIWLAIARLVRGMLDDAPADVDDLLVNNRIWL